MTAVPAQRGVRGAAWLVALVLLTGLWLSLASAWTQEAVHRVDCAGGLREVPEPLGWQAWPKEVGNPSGEGEHETLFGFGFSHHLPRGFWYAGYEDAKLFDRNLCPDSTIDLDGWLRTGEAFWLRHPTELSLYRDPHSDVLVIAGQYGFDARPHAPDEPPGFVTAFRRDFTPRHGWEHTGGFVEAPFWILGIAGAWVLGLRLRRSPSYAKWVARVVLAGFATLGVSVLLVVKSGFENMR